MDAFKQADQGYCWHRVCISDAHEASPAISGILSIAVLYIVY